MAETELSAGSKKFLHALKSADSNSPVSLQLSEFYDAENELRCKFAAKEPPADPYANLVPVLHSKVAALGANKTKARPVDEKNLEAKYVYPLSEEMRRKDGDDSFVQAGLAGFKRNWDIFTEGALSQLNWDNVFAAGGAVLACLQPLPDKVLTSGKNGPTPRALREYFHKKAYPASDIDLFLYGLKDEDAAKTKMLEIYENIKACARADVTCIRSTHAVTIVCEWPQRHIQIILRLYSSPSEILAGFDVDACAVGYNGSQVYAAPRAFISLVTQSISVDMSRRSPSYELRLAKYARRGFEIFVPDLKRENIDPTIYDRSPTRLQGLARLLVLVALKDEDTRASYLKHRRDKRSRPPLPHTHVARNYRRQNMKRGDLKAAEMDGIFENNYDSIHIPYGQRFNVKNIERLMFQRDMVLNAEWNPRNVPPQREWKLHRHPCFFGEMSDIFEDCCGHCPEPDSPEAAAVQKEEDERLVRGPIKFMVDNPGRQSVGSFRPITDGDWSEMAYLSNEEIFASAVANNDVGKVTQLVETFDVNKRDHTGRTMLFLAGLCGSNGVAQTLVEKGARLTARNFDGRTIAHLACQTGNLELLNIVLAKSKTNANEKAMKVSQTDTESDSNSDDGFEKIRHSDAKELNSQDQYVEEEDDIIDLNVPDWDYTFTPLHHAIFAGHLHIVKRLMEEEAVDITISVKIPRGPEGADWTYKKQTIFPIVLCAYPNNGLEIAEAIVREGVSSQSDSMSTTAFHMLVQRKRLDIVKLLIERDPKAKSVINYLSRLSPLSTPVSTAAANDDMEMLCFLLEHGGEPSITQEQYLKYAEVSKVWWFHSYRNDTMRQLCYFGSEVIQPIERAIGNRNLDMVKLLVQYGANVHSAPCSSYQRWEYGRGAGFAYIDLFKERIIVLKRWLDNESVVRSVENTSEGPDGSFLHWIEALAQQEEKEASIKESDSEDDSDNSDTETSLNSAMHAMANLELDNPGVNEVEARVAKRAAIEKEFNFSQKLHDFFVFKNAKSWNDLDGHDKIRNASPVHLAGYLESLGNQSLKTAKTNLRFQSKKHRANAADQDAAYLELFELVWRGDIAGIKSRTLSRWGPDGRNEPLQIAVWETTYGVTPVMIALRQKRFDLARMLLQIAQVQYRPKDQNVNYYVERDDPEEIYSDAESDASEFHISGEAIDNIYELGDVTSIPDQAKSDMSALQFLRKSLTRLSRFISSAVQKRLATHKLADSGTVLTLAVIENDFGSFVKILDLAGELDPHGADRLLMSWEICGASMDMPTGKCNDLKVALALGRLEFVQEILRRTGWGIDYDQLEVELDANHQAAQDVSSNKIEAPRYYAGLRVRGKFRRDWAKATAPRSEPPYHATKVPIAFLASYYGHSKIIQWMFSDGPAKAIEAFITQHKSDKRAKILEKVDWKQRLSTWFGTNFTSTRNALHAAILGHSVKGIDSVFKEFIKKQITPLALLNSVSSKTSPIRNCLLLSVQFESCFTNILEKYLTYNGDATVKDDRGFNVLHLLTSSASPNESKLRYFLNRVTETQRDILLSSRTSDTLSTPIVLAVQSGYVNVVKALLEHGTEQLQIRDGDGNLPVHIAISKGFARITQLLITADPSTLQIEDSSGVLPLEIAQHRQLIYLTQTHPFGGPLKEPPRDLVRDQPKNFVATKFLDGKTKHVNKDNVNPGLALQTVREAFSRLSSRKRQLSSLSESTGVIQRAVKRLEKPKGEASEIGTSFWA